MVHVRRWLTFGFVAAVSALALMPAPPGRAQPELGVVDERAVPFIGMLTRRGVDPWFLDVYATTGVSIDFGDLESGVWGLYTWPSNRIVLSTSLLAERREAAGTVLAHELTHAAQWATHGPVVDPDDCLIREADAYRRQARVIEVLGATGSLRTDLEWHLRQVRAMAQLDRRGTYPLERWVLFQPSYFFQCVG